MTGLRLYRGPRPIEHELDVGLRDGPVGGPPKTRRSEQMTGRLNQLVAAEQTADLQRSAESYRRASSARRPQERPQRDRLQSFGALRRLRLRVRPV